MVVQEIVFINGAKKVAVTMFSGNEVGVKRRFYNIRYGLTLLFCNNAELRILFLEWAEKPVGRTLLLKTICTVQDLDFHSIF